MKKIIPFFEEYSWSNDLIRRIVAANTPGELVDLANEYWCHILGVTKNGLAVQMADAANIGYYDAVKDGDSNAEEQYWSKDALWYGFLTWISLAIKSAAYEKDNQVNGADQILNKTASLGIMMSGDDAIADATKKWIDDVKTERMRRNNEIGNAINKSLSDLNSLIVSAQSSDFQYDLMREFLDKWYRRALALRNK